MSAHYKITTKVDSNNNDPLLLMTIQLESQLVLNPSRLTLLHDAVSAHFDGNEVFTDEERAKWIRILEDLRLTLIRLREVPVVSRIDLESPWQEFPTRFINKILDKFVIAADPNIRVFLQGQPPEFEVVFNVGAASVTAKLPASEVAQAVKDVAFVKKMIADGKNDGKSDPEISEALDLAWKAGLVASGVVGCGCAIAGVGATAGLELPGAIIACGAAVDGAKGLMDAIEKQQQEWDDARTEADRVRNSNGSQEFQRSIGDKIGGFAEPSGW